MRFYVPEWDDAVDAGYDFEHDELSDLNRQERELNYIWDIFDKESTPIDGVLISREQVESTKRKEERITQYGVYDDPVLSVPEWLPTISDCGAWGYKSLPFPPYGNEDMLDFYETLDVSVGVTIDHLVLGSGKEKGRLYLDERAFGSEFSKSDIPSELSESVDLMIDEWPDEWPDYVEDYEASICSSRDVDQFTATDFEGDIESVLNRLADDYRAVYRTDDKQFRYNLTLENAAEMRELYQAGAYPFRLMVAIQGWNVDSYVSAAEEVLDIGYNYLGIGGVAGSPVHEVRKIVKEVGKTVKDYERTHQTRIDSHVFGFAKSDAFDSIGRSGMASFDSASMLRSAWTGGRNYRVDGDERYDAIRVQYPKHGAKVADAVETALRGRETLVALRAYANEESIADSLREWKVEATKTLTETITYVRNHRHEEKFNSARLRDIESAFRSDFEYARQLKAYFSDDLRGQLIKHLRSDDKNDSLPFETYIDLLGTARAELKRYPRMVEILEREEAKPDGMDAFERLWFVIQDYAIWIGNDDLLEAYQETLSKKPWDECDCPICTEHGIEVCIFRGNDRNRRRGFHNTAKFYDEFSDALPKTLVLTNGSATFSNHETVEEYLASEQTEFWQQVHDLPVAEIGAFDANGIHEWWAPPPSTVSFAPDRIAAHLNERLGRYDVLYLYKPGKHLSETLDTLRDDVECNIHTFEEPTTLRETVLSNLGTNYSVGSDFAPHKPVFDADQELDILVIDQCSGSKYVPDGERVFEADEIDQTSKADLLSRENVIGVKANELYTGRQQESISNAVRQLRADGHSVKRYFVSAGFGLVEEAERLPPYEVTFSGMSVGEIRDRSEKLKIKTDLNCVLDQTDYDIVFFTLGDDYYNSIDIDSAVQRIRPDRIGVVFNQDLVGEQYDNIVSVSARTKDAKRHETIVIGLKGLYLENFAQNLRETTELDPDVISLLCRYLEEDSKQAAIEKF
ncbi:queuine tRNA-ribosyltransferase tRNA-guanine transglycosylase [Haloarcula sp. 1CSR25-25]|uniref:queuine tRNA-ribosyltransferase tRNA-guanine transglycosylase n=1 Tax=Haloarcula sp. 1CSR25-25 TaxID=2862545 RepID=UPI0028956131|nr:queuine tRNA-ribosyltransferase tRNA-guanine transglycosylase [Haloarcula sp. 1CSR25-25]MDT3433250.1 queuine tRNA-ribosyltransferase tRNA-guanine transglycosylase [Haloarcula sp. 1CSR25-25]